MKKRHNLAWWWGCTTLVLGVLALASRVIVGTAHPSDAGVFVATLACTAYLMADTLSPLGLLNWCVLQWFGVRLIRCCEHRPYWTRSLKAGEIVRPGDIEMRRVTVGWAFLRWVWPLTGWWNDYRWIARRR